MERTNVSKLVLIVVFLVLRPRVFSMPMDVPYSRPLCASQFALVNHACAMLPFNPGSPTPPSPDEPNPPPIPIPSPPDDPDDHGSGHGHAHRHERHRRHREREESPIEQECCRWLRALDDECVCDLLVRLPPFLSRPIHQYTIEVDESCTVSYACSMRLKP